MLIVDFSEISYSNILREFQKELNNVRDQDMSLLPMIRHQILNSIRSVNTKFRGKYGELVISCDAQGYWRSNIFPFYKVNRKLKRVDSPFDFDLLAKMVNQIKSELKEYFPYRLIESNHAESDDVIATLSKLHSTDKRYFDKSGLIEDPENVMIYSSDNDFLQLSARYPNVDCYSFKTKKVVSYPDPAEVEKYIIEKCLRGETSDGIPNVISPDNILVRLDDNGKQKLKQKSITEKWVRPIVESGKIPDEIKDKYERNRKLIDFRYIPEEVENRIISTFENYEVKGNNKTMREYFIQHKMMKHLDNILDFPTKHKRV